jgi:ubiquinone/menaquinone biosynthesis C-methylase UbiE
VSDQGEVLRAGDYFIAVEGMAMIRNLLTNPPVGRARGDEVRQIVEKYDEFPQSLVFDVRQHDVDEGYTRWAPSYDGPNPAIAREEPIVRQLLAGIAPGVALDAACGTGRHALALSELGHRVIGVDATEAMLAVARQKVPGADFRTGRLEALPVDGVSVDVVTCALALTHVDELAPVISEFARVLRPGGRAVLSDIHPFMAMTSSVAAFNEEGERGALPFVVNLPHQVSEYVQAFLGAGLAIRQCVEPPVTEEMLSVFPTYPSYPDATRDAFIGLPYLLIWELERI